MFICFIKLLLIVCEDVGGTHVVVREQLPGADSHLPPFGDRVSPDAPAAAAACISPPPHLAVGVLEYVYIQIHVCATSSLLFFFLM